MLRIAPRPRNQKGFNDRKLYLAGNIQTTISFRIKKKLNGFVFCKTNSYIRFLFSTKYIIWMLNQKKKYVQKVGNMSLIINLSFICYYLILFSPKIQFTIQIFWTWMCKKITPYLKYISQSKYTYSEVSNKRGVLITCR